MIRRFRNCRRIRYYRRSDIRSDRRIYCNDLMSRERRTTSAIFLGSISAKLPTNTCHLQACDMVSHSRKVFIKGSNLPKNRLFRVPYLWSGYGSRENGLWRLHSFHPLVDIRQMCLTYRWLLLRDVPFSSYPVHVRKSPFATVSAMAKYAYNVLKQLARWRHVSDRRFALVH